MILPKQPTCNLSLGEFLDLGVRRPKEQPPEPSRLVSAKESEEAFGLPKSVKMNFIPKMMLAFAMDVVADFVNHCRDNRIKQFLKHTRFMQTCVEEYGAHQSRFYGDGFDDYLKYVERYLDFVAPDRFRMWCSIGNEVMRQLPSTVDRDGATFIAMIHSIIDYAEQYDRRMDKEYTEALGRSVTRTQDSMLKLITAMCIEFEETYGFKLEPNDITDLNLGVLSNKAGQLAEMIIKEEIGENVSKC